MKLDTHRAKYIIAREGLIIIALLICAGASYYVSTWQVNEINRYVNESKGVERICREWVPAEQARSVWDEVYDPLQSQRPQKPGEFRVQFPKSTQLSVITRTLDRDFPGEVPIEFTERYTDQRTNITARYDGSGNRLFTGFPWNVDFEKISLLFLIIAYPGYLLIRFVVWAIITVKTKSITP